MRQLQRQASQVRDSREGLKWTLMHPYRWIDESVAAYADSLGAVLASRRRQSRSGYSLSPTSLLNIPAGTSLVLPSPNGAAPSLATGSFPTFAGCLRSAQALAQVMLHIGVRISLVSDGERGPDGSLRLALEDLIGAGAIIHHLPGTKSPEAVMADATFLHFKAQLNDGLQ